MLVAGIAAPYLSSVRKGNVGNTSITKARHLVDGSLIGSQAGDAARGACAPSVLSWTRRLREPPTATGGGDGEGSAACNRSCSSWWYCCRHSVAASKSDQPAPGATRKCLHRLRCHAGRMPLFGRSALRCYCARSWWLLRGSKSATRTFMGRSIAAASQ